MAVYEFSPDDFRDPGLIEQQKAYIQGAPVPQIGDMMSPEEMGKPENGAWKLFEVLQRGEHMSANAVRWMMGNEDLDPMGALLGTRKTSFFNVADDLGLDGAERFIFGFGAGIGADPVTYLSFGSLTKIGDLAKILESQTKRAIELKAVAEGTNYFGALRKLGDAGFVTEARTVAQNIARSKTALGREMEFALNNGLDVFKFEDIARMGSSYAEQGARKQRMALSFMGMDITPDFVEKPLFRWADKASYWMNTGKVPKWIKGVFDTDVFITPTSPNMTRDEAVKMSGLVNEARRRTIDRGRAFALSAVEGVIPFKGYMDRIFQKGGMEAQDRVANLLESVVTKKGNGALKKYLMTDHGFAEHEVDDFWKHGRVALDELYRMEQAAGVATGKAIGLKAIDAEDFMKTGILDEAIDDVAYVPHLLTDYGKKALFGDEAGKMAPRDMAKWMASHISNKERHFVNADGTPWTLRQIQNMAEKEGFWVGDKFYAPGEIKENLFSTDLPAVYAVRYMRAARAMVAKTYMEDLAEAVGAVAPHPEGFIMTHESSKIPFGWVQPQKNPYWKTSKVGGVEQGWFVPPEVAKLVDETFTQLTNSDEINKGLEWMDKMTGIWKASTLAGWPAYHMRNFTGNAWQYMLAGAHKDPASFFEGIQLSLEMKHYGRYDNPFDTVRLGDTKLAADHVFRFPDGDLTKGAVWGEMKDRGVVGGIYVAENQKRVQDALSVSRKNWQKYNPLSQEFKIYEKGFEIGQKYIEDPFRIGAYVHFRKQGLSPDAAALEVKKYFYDYFDLTKVERQLFKRIAPFYSWTRKNIPRQFAQLFDKPGYYAAIPKVREANEERKAIQANPAFWPEWIKAGMPLHIRKNPKTGEHEYMLLGGYLPGADLAHVVDPGGLFFDMLSPLLKEPYQQITNFDNRYEREIQRYPGEVTEFASVPVPVRLSHILRNIRAMTVADRIFTKNELTLGEKVVGEVGNQFAGSRLSRVDAEKQKTSAMLAMSKKLSDTRREITRQSNAYMKGRKSGVAITNIRTLQRQESDQSNLLDRLRRMPAEVGL